MNYFYSIPAKFRLLIGILIIGIIAIFVSYLLKGLVLTIIVCVFLFIVLYFSKPIWFPDDHGRTVVRRISLWCVITTASSFPIWDNYFNIVISKKFIKSQSTYINQSEPSIYVLVFVLLCIAVINYFNRDTTAMGKHSSEIEKEFPKKDFKQKLNEYIRVLSNELNNIDLATNWNDYYYTPVEAEVEIISDYSRRKKISDLLVGIKQDKKSKTFLVLGDPGSGKSVALRKLAKDLLSEVHKTGKVPIYINLKEWKVEKKWTSDNPPTVEALYNFVLNNLKARGDIFANNFIDEYFEKMYEYGRLFFLLDSFDEIPDVLDLDESSWVIDELSDVVFRFLDGAHQSRGILSSRLFRRPTNKFKAKTKFELRPFTEYKIEKTFNMSIDGLRPSFFIELFKNRPHLVPLARNPFLAGLMIRFCKENNLRFPENQAELFESYLYNRLANAENRIKKIGLNVNDVLIYCKKVSFFLYESDKYGLDIEKQELAGNLFSNSKEIQESIINILTYTKIGRESADGRFSFVHRRFHEFFVIRHIKDNGIVLPLESIPTDSRWRDALVLYCEIADDKMTKEIANYCWAEISKLADEGSQKDTKQFLRSLHCLRFLSDSFKSKKNALEDFIFQLRELIITAIDSKRNILLKKYSVEATGILPETDVETVIERAFDTRNYWLHEIAFKASRYLPRINKSIENNILFNVMAFDIIELIKKQKELNFSLSLSDAFSNIKRRMNLRVLDYKIMLCGLFLMILFQPYFAFFLIAMYFFIFKIVVFLDGSRIPKKHLFIFFCRAISFIFLFALFTTPFLIEKSFILSFLGIDSSIHNHLILIGCYLLIFPFFDFYFYFKETKLEFPRLKDILFILGVTIGTLGLFYLASLKPVMPYVVGGGKVISGIFIVVMVYYLTKYISNVYKDYILFKKYKQRFLTENEFQRATIESNLNQFKTELMQGKYVRALSNFSIMAVGDWEKNELPVLSGENATVLLAMLEEKWLKLA